MRRANENSANGDTSITFGSNTPIIAISQTLHFRRQPFTVSQKRDFFNMINSQSYFRLLREN